MQLEPHILSIIQKYIAPNDIYGIKNIRIASEDNQLKKKLLLPKRVYRQYYLEVFNPKKQRFLITFKEKKELQNIYLHLCFA